MAAQAKAGLQRTRQAEDAAFEEQKVALQQRYIDGESTTESYQEAMRMLELEHARKVVAIYKEGTEERLAAERSYQNLLFADTQKRRQKAESEEKKHQQRLEAIKKEYFGMNAMERQQALTKDLAALQLVYQDEIRIAGTNAKEKLRIEEAYQKAKAALIRKYGGEELNGMQQATQAVVDWLDSDHHSELRYHRVRHEQHLQWTVGHHTGGVGDTDCRHHTAIRCGTVVCRGQYVQGEEAGTREGTGDSTYQERGEQENVCHAGDTGCGTDGNSGHQCLQQTMAATAAALSSYSSVIDKLNKRLNEPFVTVNTVEGDRGIKRAQDEYDNLMRNKTPRFNG